MTCKSFCFQVNSTAWPVQLLSLMEIFSILAGLLYAYTGHVYLVISIVLQAFVFKKPRYLAGFILAAAYAFVHQWWVLPALSVEKQVLKQADIHGRIISIPAKTSYKTQFYFQLDTLDGKKANALLLLSWYNNAPALAVGQVWQLKVKMKKARNLNNPGGFDYVQWLKARHVLWTGYVKTGPHHHLIKHSEGSHLLRLRERLAQHLAQLSPDLQVAGILKALSLGLTDGIDPGLWDLFRRTGTTHLRVISGAHIGLIAGLVFWLFKWLWTRSVYCCLRLPAVRAASLAGFIGALLYALIAGFAVPAQRAMIAIAFFTLHCWGSKKYSGWQGWRYAVLAVVIFEPHAVLMPGFYLSFMAVAVMMLVGQRWHMTGLRQMLLMQAACLIGLLPLSLFWFSYTSIIGFIANLFAIPLVGFCIVPMAMMSLLCIHSRFVIYLMKPLSSLVYLLLKLLSLVDLLSVINISVSFSQLILTLGMMLVLLLFVLLPVRTFQWAALMIGMSVFFPSWDSVKAQEAIIEILDVGQGLSVVVRTKNHRLIYDTGDKFYQGSDMAQLAILPFLSAKGIKRIDKLIISHPDKDHRGGMLSLEAGTIVSELIVDSPPYYHRGRACHSYPAWRWDGIDFRFFPIKKRLKGKNNHSCVLQISRGKSRVLLAGDIEKSAETYLIKRYGSQLQSSVLLIPHHGSKTSSSADFLKTVQPRYAIASLGFDNRFHFPHQTVVALYSKLGIPVYLTRDCGMVTIHLSDQDKAPVCYGLH